MLMADERPREEGWFWWGLSLAVEHRKRFSYHWTAKRLRRFDLVRMAMRFVERVRRDPKHRFMWAERWMSQITGREVREVLGNRKVRDALDSRWRSLMERDAAPVEEEPTLLQILDGLPLNEMDRQMLDLFATGMDHRDVAHVMGLTRDGVYKRLRRLAERYGDRIRKGMGLPSEERKLA